MGADVNKMSRSPSASRSPSPRKRSRSPPRSKSRSPSRSPSPAPRKRSFSRSPGDRRSYSRDRSPSPYRRPNQVDAPPNRIIGIFGLSGDTRESDLRDTFTKFGPLEDVKLIIDKRTNESKRFGFIYFENQEDAVKAKSELNGMTLDGRKVRIDFSQTKRAHSPTPGKYLGKIRYDRPSGGGRYGGPPPRRYDPYDRRD